MKVLIIVAIMFLFGIIFFVADSAAMAQDIPDKRNIRTGWEIPTESYSDQPYIVKTDDGAWLCIVTTGAGREGASGQHVVTMRSTDFGKTWSETVDVEPADGPEASYAVMLKLTSGRIYAFYNHNTDNLRKMIGDIYRVDSQGYFVFKYSDDHGRSWSEKRYNIPIREMEIDRQNVYGGKIQFFWNVGKPFIIDGAGYVSLHKVGGFGYGTFTTNEGVLLKSDNILTEKDPEKIRWETLPDGDYGLRTPPGGGPIAAEQSYSVLSDASIYCVYRTIDGHPVFTYSRDGGHTWDTPQYKKYGDGRLMKHPRAANFAWKCNNGKYLYWFHNHGGRFILEHPKRRGMAYDDRNPVWLCGGTEVDSPEGKVIKWSQPEIVLYDDDTWIRISYPDLVEEDGKYFLTETQKDIARVHEIDLALLDGLWNQSDNKSIARDGLILELPKKNQAVPRQVDMPELKPFLVRSGRKADHGTEDLRTGFAIGLWLNFKALSAGQILLDNRTENGQGWCLQTTERGTVEIILNDGRTENRWDCDPGLLQKGKLHHITINVDGGPKIITFIIDGKLCDGADYRQFGWGRFSPNLYHVNGAKMLRIAPDLKGEIKSLRIYNRYLTTSESIGNYQAGLKVSKPPSRNKIHKESILSNSERVNCILKQFGEDLILWAFQKEGKMKSRKKTKESIKNHLQHPNELFLSFLLRIKDDKSMQDTLIKLSGRGLFLSVKIDADTSTQSACFFTQYEGAQVKIPTGLLNTDRPNAIYVTYEQDRYLTLFVNGQLVEFTPVHGSMPSGSSGITIGSYTMSCSDTLKLPSSISELVIGARIPSFEQRFHFHRLWEAEYGLDFDIYPVFQYYNIIMVHKDLIVRDPSEILHINGRFWVYFTGVKAPVRDGFKGTVYSASCADTDDPSRPENWGEPIEVIQKGNPQTDHDGTGCFTPDCYYDGSNIFIFYTGLNSTHLRGFPQWGPVREPEHIMVAKSTRPEGVFHKTPKHTPLTPETRTLNYNEATIPGGHEYLNSEPLYDVSLIDHGQCWVMDDGERRYYYKGGGGGDYSVARHKGKHGAVCLMRGFDENWLNGYRHSTDPIIYENSHMEGVLITRVQDQLFLQTMVFGPPRVWVTYTSPADDGINWKFIDDHHWPKLDCTYPLSIGVYPTVNPEWGIGQFPIEDSYIGLAYLRIL